jgi:hypothetical protein
VLACAASAGQDPVLPKGTDDLGSTIKTENFTIYYRKDFADDAQKAKTYLNNTIESMVKEFSDYEPEKILKKVDCYVYLYPEPNEKANDGTSRCITWGLDNGRRHAELHFLTPAVYSPNSMDSIGELKKEDHYFFRYIVHEYSSIFLGVITRSKSKGWSEDDAPNWFVQGYEEYLGMTLSSEHSRTVTFSKYMDVVKKDPDQVMIAHGYKDKSPRIVVQRDYTDGFALLAFMHHQFGKKAVQRILVSEKATFWEAMKDSFQMDTREFYEKYQEWVHEWKPSMTSP